MKFIQNILSLLCSLISAITTFLICIYLSGILDALTHERFSGVWRVAGFISGLILGLVVSGVVRNLIYKEPTRF
ncbi:MAG: hypothetical protein WCX65_15865 [bacterium]